MFRRRGKRSEGVRATRPIAAFTSLRWRNESSGYIMRAHKGFPLKSAVKGNRIKKIEKKKKRRAIWEVGSDFAFFFRLFSAVHGNTRAPEYASGTNLNFYSSFFFFPSHTGEAISGPVKKMENSICLSESSIPFPPAYP